MARAAENVVAFYNKRGTCEQWIKEGKGAIKWARLSCRTFAANAVQLQLHALAYNLGNFLRTFGDAGADQVLVADNSEPIAINGFDKKRVSLWCQTASLTSIGCGSLCFWLRSHGF
jgi:Transposase DDE domain group 1